MKGPVSAWLRFAAEGQTPTRSPAPRLGSLLVPPGPGGVTVSPALPFLTGTVLHARSWLVPGLLVTVDSWFPPGSSKGPEGRIGVGGAWLPRLACQGFCVYWKFSTCKLHFKARAALVPAGSSGSRTMKRYTPVLPPDFSCALRAEFVCTG